MNWLFIIMWLSFQVAAPLAAEKGEEETPSQKTKEAVEKAREAPGAAAKSLQSLKEIVKDKLQGATQTKTTAEGQGDPLAVPPKKTEPSQPRYSSTGKRDPFRPLSLNIKPVQRSREALSPLERYDLGQLKLVGIVWDIGEPRAMVEDDAGLGYTIKAGTPIGPNEGKIKSIQPTEVVVEEFYIDFYGERKNRLTSMKLPSE
jgi:type IV pilus assembly protein PilP